ncbi:hypothetical protein GCM10023191_078630 [Actinoallomurus oryzae]|uniref:DUF2249 domain-containing protein n=1 Tax=Actinoallomurus oryzae TaxID=502180 RepID=A0ABP8QXQ4_9ACTN
MFADRCSVNERERLSITAAEPFVVVHPQVHGAVPPPGQSLLLQATDGAAEASRPSLMPRFWAGKTSSWEIEVREIRGRWRRGLHYASRPAAA